MRADRGPLEARGRSASRISIRFSRARDSRGNSIASMPEFAAGNSLRLEAARNPVLEATLRPQGRKAVPLSLALRRRAKP